MDAQKRDRENPSCGCRGSRGYPSVVVVAEARIYKMRKICNELRWQWKIVCFSYSQDDSVKMMYEFFHSFGNRLSLSDTTTGIDVIRDVLLFFLVMFLQSL